MRRERGQLQEMEGNYVGGRYDQTVYHGIPSLYLPKYALHVEFTDVERGGLSGDETNAYGSVS